MYKKSETRVHWSDWEVGEVYYRENGTQPFVITYIPDGTCRNDSNSMDYMCDYLNGTRNIPGTKTYLIKAEIEGEIQMANNTLYQVKGHELYGTQIATNSEGKIVLEMKGTSEVKAYEKSELEEVMPYTVGVKFIDGGQNYHFETDKGNVSEGDLIVRLDDGHYGKVAEVVSLDTKSKAATKRLNAFVLKGTRVK